MDAIRNNQYVEFRPSVYIHSSTNIFFLIKKRFVNFATLEGRTANGTHQRYIIVDDQWRDPLRITMRLSLAGNRQYDLLSAEISGNGGIHQALLRGWAGFINLPLQRAFAFFVNTRNIGEFVARPTVKGTAHTRPPLLDVNISEDASLVRDKYEWRYPRNFRVASDWLVSLVKVWENSEN